MIEERLRAAKAVVVVWSAEAILAQDRGNGGAMAAGAVALAVLGETDRAREWIGRALVVDPANMGMRYNLACAVSAHLGDIDGALDLLGPFFTGTGKTFLLHAKIDPDLDRVRGAPRFKAMMAEAEARLAES